MLRETSCRMTSLARLCRKSSGVINSFQTFSVTMMITVAITGLSSGNTMVKNFCIVPQPSISAASSSSTGTVE